MIVNSPPTLWVRSRQNTPNPLHPYRVSVAKLAEQDIRHLLTLALNTFRNAYRNGHSSRITRPEAHTKGLFGGNGRWVDQSVPSYKVITREAAERRWIRNTIISCHEQFMYFHQIIYKRLGRRKEKKSYP